MIGDERWRPILRTAAARPRHFREHPHTARPDALRRCMDLASSFPQVLWLPWLHVLPWASSLVSASLGPLLKIRPRQRTAQADERTNGVCLARAATFKSSLCIGMRLRVHISTFAVRRSSTATRKVKTRTSTTRAQWHRIVVGPMGNIGLDECGACGS
jgi:hypothetical protein